MCLELYRFVRIAKGFVVTVKTVDAIFEHGVFRPVNAEALAIPEGQQVRLVIETVDTPEDMLALAGQVYDDLSPQEIADIESIILDRRHFFDPRSQP